MSFRLINMVDTKEYLSEIVWLQMRPSFSCEAMIERGSSEIPKPALTQPMIASSMPNSINFIGNKPSSCRI